MADRGEKEERPMDLGRELAKKTVERVRKDLREGKYPIKVERK